MFDEMYEKLLKTEEEIGKLNSMPHPKWKMNNLKIRRRKLRALLYDCECCTDATIKGLWKHNGHSDEIAIGCHRKQCLYHDYFKNKAQQKQGKMIDALSDMSGEFSL